MTKAIFLDRDGTINEERGYLRDMNDLVLIAGAATALKRLKENGYLLILTTNQSGPARGYYSEDHVKALNERLQVLLKQANGVKLDAVYYCPHLPDGSVPEYTRDCECRKPHTGMIQWALLQFPSIDVHQSWVFGDKATDVELAHNAGCRSALLLSGYGERVVSGDYQSLNVEPTLICPSINEAVDAVLAYDCQEARCGAS